MQSTSELLHSIHLSTDGKFKNNFHYLFSLDQISICTSQDEIHLFEKSKQEIQYTSACITIPKEEMQVKPPPKLHSTEEILEAYDKKLIQTEKKKTSIVYHHWIRDDLLLTLNSENRIQIYKLFGK